MAIVYWLCIRVVGRVITLTSYPIRDTLGSKREGKLVLQEKCDCSVGDTRVCRGKHYPPLTSTSQLTLH